MRGLKNSYVSMAGWGLLLAGALSFASCSSDETIDGIDMQGKAITFGNVSIKENSRATDPSYSANDIENFQVWGTVKGNTNNTIKIFDGATISKGTAAYGEVWTQADGQTQYWIPDADYEFLAIVDGNKPGVTTTKLADAEPKMPESISYTADGETDLLCQKVTRLQNSDESVVAFTFAHLLSKVHFTFISTSSLKTITVTDIQIAGHYASGTYTIANATWGGQVKAESIQPLDFGDAEATITTTGVTSQLARLIIPGNDQTLTISFNQDGEKVEKELTHDFAPNTQYNIQITIEGGSEITFKIESLEAWGAKQDIPLNP